MQRFLCFMRLVLLSCLPCFHLSPDSAPSFRDLIGFFLIAFQLRAAVWVEPAEHRPRLFGFRYLQLQGLKNDLLLCGLELPVLETFDISQICLHVVFVRLNTIVCVKFSLLVAGL